MERPIILVAHAATFHADALTRVLPALRPDLAVEFLEPEALDISVAARPGTLVICDRLTPAIEAGAAASILLYPDGANVAVVTMAGTSRRIETPNLAALVAALDSLLADLAAEPGMRSDGRSDRLPP